MRKNPGPATHLPATHPKTNVDGVGFVPVAAVGRGSLVWQLSATFFT
jgi:hypothetical protein